MLRNPPPEDHPRLSIGQASQRTGLSTHALRFYEREGLLPDPVQRGQDGRRAYDEDDLEWLQLCVKLRSSGMPLAAIRQYAELVRQGDGNEQQRLSLLRQHKEHVTAQITELTACLEMITFKVTLYEESLIAGTADPIWSPATVT
jgi:DNA-binding transcriptional MerR regulator